MDSGRRTRAFEVAAEAVELAQASGDGASVATSLRNYANAATYLNRFDDAEKALAEAEAIPGASAHLRMRLLHGRALLNLYRGDLERAAHMFEQLRNEHRSLGNDLGEHNVATNLAEVEHARGRSQRAIAIARETLLGARSGTDKILFAHILHNLAGYLAAVDDLPGTTAAAREAIGIHAARNPDHAYVAIGIEHLALAVALRGDHVRAATLEGFADAALRRHGFRRSFTETTTYDRVTALLRKALAPDDLARLTAEGAALTPEAAIALALAEP